VLFVQEAPEKNPADDGTDNYGTEDDMPSLATTRNQTTTGIEWVARNTHFS